MLSHQLLAYSAFAMILVFTSCGIRLIDDVGLDGAISYSLEMAQDSSVFGDELYVNFIIENGSDQDIFIDNNPYGFFIEGSHVGGFQLSAKREDGGVIESTYGKYGLVVSGFYGIDVIHPSKKMTIPIRVHDHIRIQNPGVYKLYVSKMMSVYFDKRRKSRSLNTSINRCFKKRIFVHEELTTSFEVFKVESE